MPFVGCGLQVVEPGGEERPFLQGTQTPFLLYVLRGQVLHELLSQSGTEPPGQAWQEAERGALTRPRGQAVQKCAPACENSPAGQLKHRP
jgi:hypothetical protein